MVFWDTTLGSLPDKVVSEEFDAASFMEGDFIPKTRTSKFFLNAFNRSHDIMSQNMDDLRTLKSYID
jgi:hypothetical protein